MSVLLARYNDAMRLGMGFNSYTQQLCVNDAVTAPEAELQAFAAKVGTDVIVSQDVIWTAKFVDNLSEVSDSMNISGALQIKCDAIGGSGEVSSSLVNAERFKSSDINYLIQVKVVNRRYDYPELSEFNPIDNVSAADFTRVYGDSFISGFIEGGDFHALVSIKLNDRSKVREIKGKLEIDLNLKAASVSGSGEAGTKKTDTTIDGETMITVTWQGGGHIKDPAATDWDFATLKAVAMAFPDHVMACPMRTKAILTKYTTLKSFYENFEKLIVGTPLDYETAGMYSSSLLDAYVDYKIIWRTMSEVIWDVRHGMKELAEHPAIPNARKYEDAATERYNTEKARYDAELTDYGTTHPDKTVKGYSPPLPPLPPLALTPFDADIMGLEQAREHCRLEMAKIVREVDVVARNPKLACDPSRGFQYLSPAIFEMLLPLVRDVQQATQDSNDNKDTKDTEDTNNNNNSHHYYTM